MPSISVLHGPDRGRGLELSESPLLIGRDSELLPLADLTVSRKHAEIYYKDDNFQIRDLDSSNGTLINGVQLVRPRPLRRGDQIRCGGTLFLFSGGPTAAGIAATGDCQRAVKVDTKNQVDAAITATVATPSDTATGLDTQRLEAVDNLQTLYEISAAIGSSFDLNTLLERIMDLVFQVVAADRGFVLLIEDPSGRLTTKAVRYRDESEGSGGRITISHTIVNHVIRRQEGVISSNAMTDARFTSGKSVHDVGIRSAICVPIKAHDKVLGVIHIDSLVAAHTYSTEQLHLMRSIGLQTGLAIENVKLYQAGVQAERLAATGQTVAYLSHYIKNILQGLRGGSDLVEMSLKKDNLTAATDGWRIVQRNLDKIFALMMNMLAFSKERQPRLEPSQIQIPIQEACALARSIAADKHVELATEVDDEMPAISCDTDAIHQIVLNLVTNAVDAVDSGVGKVHVRAHYDSLERQAVIRVSDNGVGIPQSEQGLIFDAFHSTKGQKGTGLGLAVAKKIIREHGGALTLESEPGKGTVFCVTLPTVHKEQDLGDTHGG